MSQTTTQNKNIKEELIELTKHEPVRDAKQADKFDTLQEKLDSLDQLPPLPDRIHDTELYTSRKRYWEQYLEDRKRLALGKKQVHNTQYDEAGHLYESVVDVQEEEYDPDEISGEDTDHHGDARKLEVVVNEEGQSVPVDRGITPLMRDIQEYGFDTIGSCSGLVDDHPEKHYLQQIDEEQAEENGVDLTIDPTTRDPEYGMAQNGYIGFVFPDDDPTKKAVVKEAARRAGLSVEGSPPEPASYKINFDLSVRGSIAKNGANREKISRNVGQELMDKHSDIVDKFYEAQNSPAVDRLDEVYADIVKRFEDDLDIESIDMVPVGKRKDLFRIIFDEVLRQTDIEYSKIQEHKEAFIDLKDLHTEIQNETEQRWQEQADELLTSAELNARWQRFRDLLPEVQAAYRGKS